MNKVIKIKHKADGLELFYFVQNLCSGLSYKELIPLAEAAEVSPSTIYRWCHYDVISPHLRTVCRVLGALGYDIQTTTKAATIKKKTKIKPRLLRAA